MQGNSVINTCYGFLADLRRWPDWLNWITVLASEVHCDTHEVVRDPELVEDETLRRDLLGFIDKIIKHECNIHSIGTNPVLELRCMASKSDALQAYPRDLTWLVGVDMASHYPPSAEQLRYLEEMKRRDATLYLWVTT